MCRKTLKTLDARANRQRRDRGMALLSVLLLSAVALILTGALAAMMLGGMKGSNVARAEESAYSAAQAGINSSLFQIEAGTDAGTAAISMETYLANNLGTASNGSARTGSKQFTGTLTGGSYTVTLADPSAGDNLFTLSSVGKDKASGRTRTLVALVRAQPVVALNYAMFGNEINFHNHNKQAYAVTLNTSMFSNGSILIDRGISIIGPAQAVNAIQPNTGPASGTSTIPNTILCGAALVSGTCGSPVGQQGDPKPMTSDPAAPIAQSVPSPPIEPFPTFDFGTAQSTASTAGRQLTPTQLTTLIANAQTYANSKPSDGNAYTLPSTSYPSGVSAASVPISVIHYKTSAGNPDPRVVTVPNGTNASAYVPLGSPSTATTEPTNPASNTNLYEIDFVGKPLTTDCACSDSLLYVTGAVDITEPTTTLVQIQGSLIVNGSLGIHAPLEVLAWDNRTGANFVPLGSSLYTDNTGVSTVATTNAQAAAGQPYDVIYSRWPAISANGPLKVDDSSGGNGGPVHIEGAMYTVAESHFHKSNPYESSYAVGSEIADTIHNCQFFSFAYDPQAKNTLGFFNKAAGRVQLQVIRLEDHH